MNEFMVRYLGKPMLETNSNSKERFTKEELEKMHGVQCTSSNYYPVRNYKADFMGWNIDNPIFNSPKTMPVEARSLVYYENGRVRVAIYKNGYRIEDTYVMPDIIDVSVVNDRVVFVTFTDGTKERAVLTADDQFSLEQGISICVTKKLLSMKTDNNGSSVYNKIIKEGLKVVEDKKKKAEAEKQEKQVKNNRIKKLEAKKARKANAAREAQIEIQKEAYLRAMREFNGASDCVTAE